jgi:hypothetical protein
MRISIKGESSILMEKENWTGYLIRGIHPFSTAKAATVIDKL